MPVPTRQFAKTQAGPASDDPLDAPGRADLEPNAILLNEAGGTGVPEPA